MILESIDLINFRNYKQLTASFSPTINVFHGKNGQGKTNLLEAIYLGTIGRSHRSNKETDFIRKGENGYKIELTFQARGNYRERQGIEFIKKAEHSSQKAGRKLLHDGMQIHRQSDWIGKLQAVLFAPEDLLLLREGPDIRRRFLNSLLFQVNRAYVEHLQTYKKLLEDRNAILKNTNYDASQKRLLISVWDEQLVKHGSAVVWERCLVCQRLSELVSTIYPRISRAEEKISLFYQTSLLQWSKCFIDIQNVSRETLEATYREKLDSQLEVDLLRGFTSVGPHRDDLRFLMNEEPAASVASQGQTRSIVLALKLAEMEWIKECTKNSPILLLDDVMSELDETRRVSLVNSLENTQVFITCTEPALVKSLWEKSESKRNVLTYYHIEGGQLAEKGLSYTVL